MEEEWYFSIIDVVRILTESKDPNAYWRKLKQRLKAEGNETVTNCHALKASATEISKQQNPHNIGHHVKIAKSGGNVAKAAKNELEAKLGRSVISSDKAADYLTGDKTHKEIE